ncbi:MAG TPA: glycoside hydrolase family 57 protein [Spongiibacteraceae bacterium]|nr:glycoside hydrolase family 57 protein [Spongiibacteraceae bacterium]
MKVVLCWHMHQPEYRDLRSGEYELPWTYLHALKDYVDMAAHLEAHPNACAVVNFAPVLLDQIADYGQQIEHYFSRGAALRDPVLTALVQVVHPSSSSERLTLLAKMLRVNRKRVVERFPAFARLATMVDWLELNPSAAIYISDQFITDVVVWYHLGWVAETVRRDDVRIKRLQDKQQNYNLQDRLELLRIVQQLIDSLLPRYRKLAENGRIELAMSPYAHPIVPLLLELDSARAALPEVELPLTDAYPGGLERAHWHLQQGLQTFEQHFGMRPIGCWPSEGSVSLPTLQLLQQHGFRWAASGETVLRNSLKLSRLEPAFTLPNDCVHRVYRCADTTIDCFFRDDNLSDRIGFLYADWHADDAVANLIHELENIAAACPASDDTVVSIILDGENAWEYYPENGYYFLDALYKKLSAHDSLELTTFQRVLAPQTLQRVQLPALVAGSWVYGTFSTWIGNGDKNRGWDMLCEAKRAYDAALASGTLTEQQRAQATLQLAACEGSDWFWWFGDYNPAAAVSDFERLFRRHLGNLYQLLGAPIPDELSQVVSRGGGSPERGGVMLHGQAPGAVQ